MSLNSSAFAPPQVVEAEERAHHAKLAADYDTDQLRPARGILLGLLAGLAIWVGLFRLAWLVF